MLISYTKIQYNFFFKRQLSKFHYNTFFPGTQYMVNVLFSRARGPVQTYGKIQLMLVDALGINETFTLTQ